MVIRTHTGTVAGIGAVEVTVEVSITGGGLGLFLVGLKCIDITQNSDCEGSMPASI